MQKAATAKAKARKNTEAYRSRMRRAGLRPVQIWVPDTRAPGFLEECRRQSLAVQKPGRAAREEREVAEWIERVSDLEGWTA
jgi:hypothetical protein